MKVSDISATQRGDAEIGGPDKSQVVEERVGTRRGRSDDLTRTLNGLLVIFLGTLLVTFSFALSRVGKEGWVATASFWSGHALMVLPLILAVARRGRGRTERAALLLASAAAQSLVAWSYSPGEFRFPDELQHVRTALDILRSAHLFVPNAYLEVSPGFPGLEMISTSIVHMTGMSLFHAGVITAAVSHVLLPGTVMLLAREWTTSSRLGTLAAFVFGLSPHFGYFGTLFVYATIALPFMVLAVRATTRACRGTASPWAVAPPVGAVLVCHHVTTVATFGLIALILLSHGLAGAGLRRISAVGGVLVAAMAIAVVWTADNAPNLFRYLSDPLAGFLKARSSAPSREATSAKAPQLVPPAWESLVSYAAVGLTTLLMLVGVAWVLRRRVATPLKLQVAAAMAYPVVLAMRVLLPNGAELASRALTYVMLLVCLPVAIALGLWIRPRLQAPVTVAALILLSAGTITTGLPAFWQRLPGTFHIAAFESGVDPQVSAVGAWARSGGLPAGQRVACDLSVCSMLGAYARANLSTQASPLYYARRNAEARAVIRRLGLHDVFVDARTTRQVPITGSYFAGDINEGRITHALDRGQIEKFDQDPLFDRIYDNGQVRGYAVSRVWDE